MMYMLFVHVAMEKQHLTFNCLSAKSLYSTITGVAEN